MGVLYSKLNIILLNAKLHHIHLAPKWVTKSVEIWREAPVSALSQVALFDPALAGGSDRLESSGAMSILKSPLGSF